jgi:hypothetical protein
MNVARVNLVMDASNFARNNLGQASMKRLHAAVSEVERSVDGRPYHLQIVEDSGLHRYFPEKEKRQYLKFKDTFKVFSAPTGDEADPHILDWAEKCHKECGRYAIVLSGDGFAQKDKFQKYHHWLYERGAGRLFGGDTIGPNQDWIIKERQMGMNGPLRNIPLGRTLEEFLDEEFPTPRSIAREMGVSTDALKVLIVDSGLAVGDSEILTAEVSGEFKRFLSSVKKFTEPVMEFSFAKNLNSENVIKWLGDAKYEYLLRGDAPFVEPDVSAAIDQWSKSSSGTIGRYWLQKAVAEKNSQDLALALTSLDTEGDLSALKIGSFCGQLLEMGRVADWSVLKGLTSSDIEWLFQLLSIAGLSIDLDAVPQKAIASLPGTLRLLKIAREIKNELSDENVIAYFDLLFSFVSDKSNEEFVIKNDESFQLVTEALSDLVVSRSMSLSKKTWIHVADLLEILPAETDLISLAHYMSDNWEKSLLDGAGCSLKTRNLLHRRFFSDVLDAPWLTPDVFRDVAKSPSEAKRLIVGDLAPLLTSSKFVEAAHRSRDEVFELSSPAASLACTVIVSSTVGKLAGELNGLHGALTNVLNSRNGK